MSNLSSIQESTKSINGTAKSDLVSQIQSVLDLANIEREQKPSRLDAINWREVEATIRSATRSELVRCRLSSIPNLPGINLDSVNFDIISCDGLKVNHGAVSQDVVSVLKHEDAIIACLSDGASTCPHSDLGAKLVNFAVHNAFLTTHEKTNSQSLLSIEFISDLYVGILRELATAIDELSIDTAIAHELFMAATMKIAIVKPQETIVLGLSDGFLLRNDKLLECSELTERDPILDQGNFPPMPSTALIFISEERGKFNDTVGVAGAGSSELSALIFKDVASLKVLAYGSSLDLLSGTLALFSDGVSYVNLLQQSAFKVMNRFPLGELLSKALPQEIKDYAQIWNWAADKKLDEQSRHDSLEEVKKSLLKYDIDLSNLTLDSIEPILDDASGVVFRL